MISDFFEFYLFNFINGLPPSIYWFDENNVLWEDENGNDWTSQ